MFVPFVVLIATKPVESVEPFWDSLLTEPGNYRNLVVTMHEQHSAKNGLTDDPNKMVLVQGDIGINTFFLEKTVSSLGFNLMSIETPKEAFQILNSDMGSNIALVLCPEFVKEYPVEEFLAQCMAIRKKDPLFADKNLPFIVVAESQSRKLMENASELGINKVFSRPINLPSFRKTLEEMLS